MDDERVEHQTDGEFEGVFDQSSEEFGVWHGDYSWVLEPGPEDRDRSTIRETGATYDGVRDFTDLRVWRLGIDLAEEIYKITASFPQHERFGLASQLQRAAVSVPSNIAEGNARNRTGDYLRFLSIARGSLSEIKTQLVIAGRLGYIDRTTANWALKHVDDLKRQLTALYSAIERSPRSSK